MNEKECDKRIFQNRFISITLGETQEEISRKINTTRQNVGKLLSGQTLPNALLLKSICKAYGVSADYLLGITDKQNIDIDVRGCSEITGLSEEAIKNIQFLSQPEKECLCELLSNQKFLSLIIQILFVQQETHIVIEHLNSLTINKENIDEIYKTVKGYSDNADLCRYKINRDFEKVIDNFDYRIKDENAKLLKKIENLDIQSFIDKLLESDKKIRPVLLTQNQTAKKIINTDLPKDKACLSTHLL